MSTVCPPPARTRRRWHARTSPSSRRLLGPAGLAAGAGTAATFLLLADPTTPGGLTPLCPVHALTGLDCPGCGSARAVYELLHGDLVAAMDYNAVAVVAMGLLGWVWLARVSTALPVRARPTGRRGRVGLPSWHRHRWAPMVTLVVVVSWTLLRNLPWPPLAGLSA